MTSLPQSSPTFPVDPKYFGDTLWTIMAFNPPSDIEVTSRQIPAWHRVPNTSIQSKPLMIYHGAFDATPAEFTRRLEVVGEVVPQW